MQCQSGAALARPYWPCADCRGAAARGAAAAKKGDAWPVPACRAGGGGAYEIHANGRNVALSVRVIGKAQQEARFADAGVADEHQLEHVIVLLRARAASVGGQF